MTSHIRVVFVFLLLAVAGCVSTPRAGIAPAEPYVYKLGAGDRLRISVFGEPTLSGEYALDGSGMISYPLLGQIAAGARTPAEVQQEVTTRLGAEFLRSPKVSIEVANYRPVYILGEVARPGEFPYAEGMTVFALVARAGGFTYRANQKTVFIRREGQGGELSYRLEGSTVIRPGDTIRVGERYF